MQYCSFTKTCEWNICVCISAIKSHISDQNAICISSFNKTHKQLINQWLTLYCFEESFNRPFSILLLSASYPFAIPSFSYLFFSIFCLNFRLRWVPPTPGNFKNLQKYTRIMMHIRTIVHNLYIVKPKQILIYAAFSRRGHVTGNWKLLTNWGCPLSICLFKPHVGLLWICFGKLMISPF